MSYQEKRSLVNIASTILITALYAAFMMQRYPAADPYSREVFHFWGSFFLILIPISIVARILIYIVFSIFNYIATREEEPPIIDERDKLIELRAGQLSLYGFAVGVMLAMGSLVVEQPPSVMFIILICAGVVSEIISELAQFYFYRRGF
ncbi:MAG TPA: hypothetical protein VHO69_07150 [Phototrophicaceae bacterium]|nr:hypothetical protein [Phototrophicaceae bacterium]